MSIDTSTDTPGDRNFDDLAQRFERKIYESLKGEIRLRVVQRDFEEFLPMLEDTGHPWQVLDAGGGQGQMSSYFARRGHRVLLCDISAEMLRLAKENLLRHGLADAVDLRHTSAQNLIRETGQVFDLVICHGLLEWVAQPEQLLQQLASSLKAGGVLSLLYYNINGSIYKNLLRTNFKKLRQQKWQGGRGSLTPSFPLRPDQLSAWCEDASLQLMCESGVRVFHDYVFNQADRSRDPEGIVEMELHYSRLMPYRHLGRYIHLLCRREM